MNKIDIKIKKVMGRGEKLLSCLLPLGDPDLKTSINLVEVYLKAGVDIVELGMPSQNPYLDSRQIAESNQRSFQAQPNLLKYFDTMVTIRKNFPDEPFEVMTYADSVKACGLSRFVDGLKEADIDAHLLADSTVISPDLVKDMDALLNPLSIYRIRFMPHPFRENLLDDIGKNGSGFMILQSMADPLGQRTRVAEGNQDLIARLRATKTQAGILLAYGINNPQRAEEALNLGPDGILVGSAMVDGIAAGNYTALANLIRGIKAVTLQ